MRENLGFPICSEALSWHWRRFPSLEPDVLFFWRENVSAHLAVCVSAQRAGPVLWCLTASSSRPRLPCTTTWRICSRASCGRSGCARTARRTTPAGWPTPRGGRASAKRPSASLAESWQRTTRRWLSKQNPSLAMTCPCYRSFWQGRVSHTGGTSSCLLREV